MINEACSALAAVADYVRANAETFAQSGPRLLEPAEAKQRRQRIEGLAAELTVLAEKSRHSLARYQEFEAVLGALHEAGFFPDHRLVSAVARSLAPM